MKEITEKFNSGDLSNKCCISVTATNSGHHKLRLWWNSNSHEAPVTTEDIRKAGQFLMDTAIAISNDKDFNKTQHP